MANIKQAFGTSTSLTITLASLGANAARESTAVDNGTNLYEDALVSVKLVSSTTPTANTYAYIYAYGSEDGTNYTDNATGTDAAVTLRTPTNLRLIGQLAWAAVASCEIKGVFSVAQAFGGILPRKWGIVVENRGAAMAASGNAASYSGLYHTSA